jgi:hypothetical protein
MAFDLERIEEKIDRAEAGSIQINTEIGGGLKLQSMAEAFELSKLMSLSGAAVPKFLRGNPGGCLAIILRALRWGFDPFFVAEKSYLVNNKGEEKIAFEAQILHAVIEAHAPVVGRLRCRYAGEGDERTCTIYGQPKAEVDPLEYTTPTLGKLKAARGVNDYGKLKGSPLYENDPDQQLWYFGVRSWARKYYPDILGGVYTPGELGGDAAKDVTERPSLKDRLRAKRHATGEAKRGFDAENTERAITAASAPITEENVIDAVAATEPASDFPGDRPLPTTGSEGSSNEHASTETHANTAVNGCPAA